MKRTPFPKRVVLKKRTSFKHCRPKRTVEGDTAKEIRRELDQLVREILILDFCFTCGSSEEVHPGHYITRKVYALRWDMANLRPQCNFCNSEHNFDRSRYRSRLVKDIGLTKIEGLERIGRENPRVEFSELLAIRDELREQRRLEESGCMTELDDDELIICWCGAVGTYDELFDDTGLDGNCGGLGSMDCYCGGDLCVCHNHGEVECTGCDDCEPDYDDDEDDGYYDE